jgi:hypothetical protein
MIEMKLVGKIVNQYANLWYIYPQQQCFLKKKGRRNTSCIRGGKERAHNIHKW